MSDLARAALTHKVAILTLVYGRNDIIKADWALKERLDVTWKKLWRCETGRLIGLYTECGRAS